MVIKTKGPQLDNIQRVRHTGVLGAKWEAFIKLLTSRLNNVRGRKGRKVVIARGGE